MSVRPVNSIESGIDLESDRPDDLPAGWTGTAAVTRVRASADRLSLLVQPVGKQESFVLQLERATRTCPTRGDALTAFAAQIKLKRDGSMTCTALGRTSHGAKRIDINTPELVELFNQGVRTTFVRER